MPMPASTDGPVMPEPRQFTFAVGPRRMGRGYSRWVRWAKRALPLLAGIVIVLVISWARLDPQDLAPAGGKMRISASDAEALTMMNPRYVGTDSSNRPFSVTAVSAAQSSPTAPKVELAAPQAKLDLQGNASLQVSASNGAFDRDRGTLALRGGVDMTHNQGYRLTTEAVDIDIKAGTAVSGSRVQGDGPIGRMNGEGMRVEKNGDIVKLTGRSSLLIRPDAARAMKSEDFKLAPANTAPAAQPAARNAKP